MYNSSTQCCCSIMVRPNQEMTAARNRIADVPSHHTLTLKYFSQMLPPSAPTSTAGPDTVATAPPTATSIAPGRRGQATEIEPHILMLPVLDEQHDDCGRIAGTAKDIVAELQADGAGSADAASTAVLEVEKPVAPGDAGYYQVESKNTEAITEVTTADESKAAAPTASSCTAGEQQKSGDLTGERESSSATGKRPCACACVCVCVCLARLLISR